MAEGYQETRQTETLIPYAEFQADLLSVVTDAGNSLIISTDLLGELSLPSDAFSATTEPSSSGKKPKKTISLDGHSSHQLCVAAIKFHAIILKHNLSNIRAWDKWTKSVASDIKTISKVVREYGGFPKQDYNLFKEKLETNSNEYLLFEVHLDNYIRDMVLHYDLSKKEFCTKCINENLIESSETFISVATQLNRLLRLMKEWQRRTHRLVETFSRLYNP